VDVLLLYGEDASPAEVLPAVQKLTAEGHSVLAQKSVPERLTWRQLLKLTESGVQIIETNA
jgi:ATP phosphoribosyltransferase regulatory subunit